MTGAVECHDTASSDLGANLSGVGVHSFVETRAGMMFRFCRGRTGRMQQCHG